MAKLTEKWGWPSANYHPNKVDRQEHISGDLESQLTMLMEGVTFFLAIIAIVAMWVATGN